MTTTNDIKDDLASKELTSSNEPSDVYDLMLSHKHRLQLILIMDSINQIETIKKLIDLYRLFGAKKLEKFLIYLCIFDVRTNLYLKQEILYILKTRLTTKNKPFIQRAVSNTLFQVVSRAFKKDEYWSMLEENLQYLDDVIELKNMLRNIIILTFKNLRTKEPFKKIFNLLIKLNHADIFMDTCTFLFLNFCTQLTTKNKLQLLQVIFDKENEFMDNLFHIVNDQTLDLNLRLEACDILFLKGSENIKIKVQSILKNILPNTSYNDNPENVHLLSMVASVDRTLDILIDRHKGKSDTENLYQLLLDKFNHLKDFDKIQGSLNRIFNYNFLKFSKHKLTLREVLRHIWIVIDDCEPHAREEMYCRLGQELLDMYDTCSYGYVTRLINVLSGFEINGTSNLGITISYEDEIYGIFSAKINTLVQNAPKSIKCKLLEEIMVPSNDHENRLTLTRYLRPFLPQIWNEIFDIFKDVLTITDLDLYCRKVTMRYEGI